MKTCTKCGVEKSLDDFHRRKTAKDGRSSHCRECRNTHGRNRYATDSDYAERIRQRRLTTLEPIGLARPADVRFDEKWEVDENGCWIWQGATLENGYGEFQEKGKNWLAHRWSYTYARGEIREGHELHHGCGVRACVNPDHLLEVTEEAHRELHAA